MSASPSKRASTKLKRLSAASTGLFLITLKSFFSHSKTSSGLPLQNVMALYLYVDFFPSEKP
eukprot:4661709-Ditylum_brightwellii.AAC.1